MNNTTQLTVTSPEIEAFLTAWHENGRQQFEKWYPNLNYDQSEPKTAKDRSKYIALDHGTSGQFLVDKSTREVWGIRAYGQINRRHYHGTIEQLTTEFVKATATFAA